MSLLRGLRVGIYQFSHPRLQLGNILLDLLLQVKFCEIILCSLNGCQPALYSSFLFIQCANLGSEFFSRHSFFASLGYEFLTFIIQPFEFFMET